MKIGILTLFYKNYNYGGILQAYALQSELKVLGHDSEILNLDRRRLKGFQCEKKNLKRLTVHLVVNKILNKLFNSRLDSRRKAFDAFICKYVICSKEVFCDDNMEQANSQYDIFITGSDQVWSPISGRDATFLSFVHDSKGKNAYAASIGSDKVSQEYMEYMADRMKDYNRISVRERRAKEILQPVCSKEITVVIDPVFLIEKADWLKVIGKGEKWDFLRGKEYVFIYLLGDNSIRNMRSIHNICSALKLQEVYIPYGKMKITCECLVRYGIKIMDAGPAGFLRLISDAKYVFTDSFHCMAFSIIFNKRFWGLKRFDLDRNIGMCSRVEELLNVFNIEDRFVDHIGELQNVLCRMDDDIDWKRINNVIAKKRREAITFLKGIIDGQ